MPDRPPLVETQSVCGFMVQRQNECFVKWTGLWRLSLVEFLPCRSGGPSMVWWQVAEYLGCRNINRWGEHPKKANGNSAHVINLSNPSSPHLLYDCCSARHWAHCSLKPRWSWPRSYWHPCTVSGMRGKFQGELSQPHLLGFDPAPCPPHTGALCSYLSPWNEMTGAKDQL